MSWFRNLFKRNLVELPSYNDSGDEHLLKMACEILLNRKVSANNGGGGYDTVLLTECSGVFNRSYTIDGKKTTYRIVKFLTDDSWIKTVVYDDSQILVMYNQYLKTGKRVGLA